MEEHNFEGRIFPPLLMNQSVSKLKVVSKLILSILLSKMRLNKVTLQLERFLSKDTLVNKKIILLIQNTDHKKEEWK